MSEKKRAGEQYKLFDEPVHFPNGLVYRPNFITKEEEKILLEFIKRQHLEHATLTATAIEAKEEAGVLDSEYAKRRYKHFNSPLPKVLQRFAHKIEKWLHISRGRVMSALINEYTPGTQLGWHTDREQIEHVVGISLGGWARMRWRPLKRPGARQSKEVISIELEPRSAYIMQKDVRWKWQHSVAETRTLRYSITFRTLPVGSKTPSRRHR